MSNSIIFGRTPTNRHLAIRTDEEGYLETKTIDGPTASQIQGWDGTESKNINATLVGIDEYSLNTNITNSSLDVSVSNAFSTEATLMTTNSKLDSLQTTVQNKNLNFTTDSVSIGFVSEGVSIDSKLLAENAGNIYPLQCNTSGILKTEVSNFPTIQAVSGSVSVSNTVPVTGSFYQPIQPISGSISNSFTLDATTQASNTKLDAIQADLDNLTFDGTSGNLNVNIASGSVTVSSVNIKDSSGNNLNSTSNALNSYITNTSLDNHMYASSNGTTWHHLASDANGQLNVHSKTQSGAGTDITSTLNGAKQSLDVNVSNTVPVSGSVGVNNFPSSTNSHTQAYDPSGGGGYFDVTSTTISASVSALDVAVKNTVPVSGTFFQPTQPVSVASSLNVNINDFAGNSLTSDTFTFNGAPKNGLDVAIINNSSNAVPVSGDFYPIVQAVSGTVGISGTVPVSGTVSSNTKSGTGQDITATDIGGKRGLDVNLITTTVPVTGSFWQAIQTVDGTVNAKIQSSSGASIGATASSLQTYDYNVNLAFDATGEVIKTLGVAKNGSSYIPLSCDGSGYQNVILQNDNTTNSYNKNGINTYSIVPMTKTYTIGGYDAFGTYGNCMIVGNSSANISVSTYNFGSDNTRQYWAVFNNAASRLLYYDYVDATGNLVENASVTVTSAAATSLGTFVTLVDWRLATGFTASADALFIGLSSTITTLKSSSLYYEDINQKLVGVFTIPNGYIGNINTISSLVNSASGIQMNRWTSSGSRSAIWRINNTGNINVSSGYNGCFGETLTAGQSVAFSSQSAVIGKSVIASITLQKI